MLILVGRGRSQSPGLAVPHPCQNARAQRVIGGHSGDMRRRGDLDSGRYQCRSNNLIRKRSRVNRIAVRPGSRKWRRSRRRGRRTSPHRRARKDRVLGPGI